MPCSKPVIPMTKAQGHNGHLCSKHHQIKDIRAIVKSQLALWSYWQSKHRRQLCMPTLKLRSRILVAMSKSRLKPCMFAIWSLSDLSWLSRGSRKVLARGAAHGSQLVSCAESTPTSFSFFFCLIPNCNCFTVSRACCSLINLRHPLDTNRAIWSIHWHCTIYTPGQRVSCSWGGHSLSKCCRCYPLVTLELRMSLPIAPRFCRALWCRSIGYRHGLSHEDFEMKALPKRNWESLRWKRHEKTIWRIWQNLAIAVYYIAVLFLTCRQIWQPAQPGSDCALLYQVTYSPTSTRSVTWQTHPTRCTEDRVQHTLAQS